MSGDTKNTTGICTVTPGSYVCSTKQKHWILLKYRPILCGTTLNVAIAFTGSEEMLVTS